MAKGIGWAMLIPALLVMNIATTRNAWRQWTVPVVEHNSDPESPYQSLVWYADGRLHRVATDPTTGIVTHTEITSWSWKEQLDLWGPPAFCLIFTVGILWFIKRNAAVRLVELVREFGHSIAAWMFVVALIAVEIGIWRMWLQQVGAEYNELEWLLFLLKTIGCNALALIPIGIAVSYRKPGRWSKPGLELAGRSVDD